jgi:hypothetical protein
MKGSCASSRAHLSRVLETIVPGISFLTHGSGLNAFREHAHPPYLQHCLLSAIPTYIRAFETIAHGGRRHMRTHAHTHIHTHQHTHSHTLTHKHTHTHTHVQKLKHDLTYRTCRSDLHKDRRPSKLSRRAVEMQDSYASSRAHPSRVLETIVPDVSFLAQGCSLLMLLSAPLPSASPSALLSSPPTINVRMRDPKGLRPPYVNGLYSIT